MIPQRGVSVVGYGIGVVAWERLKRHGIARFGVGWTCAGLGPEQVRSRELGKNGVSGLGLGAATSGVDARRGRGFRWLAPHLENRSRHTLSCGTGWGSAGVL